MNEAAARIERHRFDDDAVVVRADRAGIGAECHVEVVGRAGGNAVVKRQLIGVSHRLIELAAHGKAQRVAAAAAGFDVEVRDQDVAPIAKCLQRWADHAERLREHGIHLATQAAASLLRFEHQGPLEWAVRQRIAQGCVLGVQGLGGLCGGGCCGGCLCRCAAAACKQHQREQHATEQRGPAPLPLPLSLAVARTEPERRCWHVERELMVALAEARLRNLDRRRDDRLQRTTLAPQKQRAARYARDVKQVVKEQCHALQLALDHVEAPAVLLAARARVTNHRHRVPHRRERVAQLKKGLADYFFLATRFGVLPIVMGIPLFAATSPTSSKVLFTVSRSIFIFSSLDFSCRLVILRVASPIGNPA